MALNFGAFFVASEFFSFWLEIDITYQSKCRILSYFFIFEGGDFRFQSSRVFADLRNNFTDESIGTISLQKCPAYCSALLQNWCMEVFFLTSYTSWIVGTCSGTTSLLDSFNSKSKECMQWSELYRNRLLCCEGSQEVQLQVVFSCE